jgi:hypothetical protein|tara:strand:+ start:297 stop:983 length:687 start_codon:yes stop_codon:yes gene_type:complete
MASDTRLNWHKTETVEGKNYQVILATADCIRKTFFIESLNVGVQFMGIGYFDDGGEKYPLSHFIEKIKNSVDTSLSCEDKLMAIFEELKSMSQVGDHGQYVKGVLAAYDGAVPKIVYFNTFNNDFDFIAAQPGTKLEKLSKNDTLYLDREEAINYINSRINEISVSQPWDVGGDIEILEIKDESKFGYIQECQSLYRGSQSELLNLIRTDINKINGEILTPPHRQEIK